LKRCPGRSDPGKVGETDGSILPTGSANEDMRYIVSGYMQYLDTRFRNGAASMSDSSTVINAGPIIVDHRSAATFFNISAARSGGRNSLVRKLSTSLNAPQDLSQLRCSGA